MFKIHNLEAREIGIASRALPCMIRFDLQQVICSPAISDVITESRAQIVSELAGVVPNQLIIIYPLCTRLYK